MINILSTEKNQTIAVGLFTLIVVTIHLIIVNQYAVNIPLYDDYNAVLDFLLKFQDAVSWREKTELILSQHNEHRIVPDRISFLLDYYIFGKVNFKHLAFVGNILLILILGLLFIQHKASKKSMYYFLPVPLILLNIRAGDFLLWAMSSIQLIGVITFSLFCIYLLFSYNGVSFKIRFWMAALVGVIASFTSGNGFLVLIICLIGLLAQRQYLYSALWLVVTILSIILYFKGYVRPPGHPDPLNAVTSGPALLVGHFFVLLGNYFSVGTPFGTTIKLFSGFFIFSIILYYFTYARLYKVNPGYFYSIWFLVLTCMLTSLSRSGFGVDQAQAGRYLVYSYVIIILVYLSLVTLLDAEKKTFKVFLWAVSLFSFFCVSIYASNFKFYLPKLEASKDILILGMVSYTDKALPLSLAHPGLEFAREMIEKSEAAGIYNARWTMADALNKDRNISLPDPTNDINSAWEIKTDNDMISINGGWAYLEGQEYVNCKTYLVLKGEKKTYTFDTHMQFRHDVTIAMSQGDLDYSGFNVFIKKETLDDDQYRVGLLISKYDRLFDYRGFEYLDKSIVKDGNTVNLIDSPPEPKDYSGILPSAEAQYSIDITEKSADTVTIRGWAILKEIPSDEISISLELISDKDVFKMETKVESRKDVAREYHGSYEESGFISKLPVKELPKGNYSVKITLSILNVKRTVDTGNSIPIE
jgi:hypothetical protein